MCTAGTLVTSRVNVLVPIPVRADTPDDRSRVVLGGGNPIADGGRDLWVPDTRPARPAVPGLEHDLTAAATLAEHRGPWNRSVVVMGNNQVGLFTGLHRRHVAVLVRTDGRRVQVPLEDLGLADVSLLGLLRSIELGIERVFVLITGSRRETGRRDKR